MHVQTQHTHIYMYIRSRAGSIHFLQEEREGGQLCTGTDRHRMTDQEADQGVVTDRVID